MSEQLFAVKDPAAVLADALDIYQQTTGATLAKADPRRLHMQAVLLFLAQQRALIDYAGKQSILRDVSEEWIDDLAEFLEEERLPAKPATTTLRLTFSTPGPHLVESGKRASGGGLLWGLDELVDVGQGETVAEAPATCTTAGAAGNGLAPGEIREMVDSVPYLDTVENVTETRDGADEESTEALRARLRDAPSGWSTAGPREAYEALARAVSQTIVDVAAVAKRDNADLAGADVDPGVVRVLVLALGGASPELLAAVAAALDEDTVRPFTDDVEVTTPETVDLSIAGTYYISRAQSGAAVEIQAAVGEAFEAYLEWQTGAMGRDINPDKLRALALAAGAKRLAFAPAFEFTAIARDQVAVLPTGVGEVTPEGPAYHVGDGTVEVALAEGGIPAPGSYRLTCTRAAEGETPATFRLYRYAPTSPYIAADVAADGEAREVAGLTVTITEGETAFAELVDRYTVEVSGVPSLAYGGLEDE